MLEALLGLLVLVVFIAGLYFQIVGIIAGFRKAWYVGLVAIVIPAFAVVIGVAKKVFGKNILNA